MNIFWFRRDLRLEDNRGLYEALQSGEPIQAVFIFDSEILDKLPQNDARVSFIHQQLERLNKELHVYGSSLKVLHDTPIVAWEQLIHDLEFKAVYTNEDYEPYAIKRDNAVEDLLKKNQIAFHTFKDQVIYSKEDILKDDGDPYTVYTPYKRKWLEAFTKQELKIYTPALGSLASSEHSIPSLTDIGFKESEIVVPDFKEEKIDNYAEERNFPSIGTSRIGPHLRFGTIGIRWLIKSLDPKDEVYLSELIWREFFMMILYHFPRVVDQNFRRKYDAVEWRNNQAEFEKWCKGETGYPLVDAGMRELNATGFMHNRVRMVVASFLCKHLLIDWKWGEAYFAEKLLDYELSANNGNWQWAAGTGCDAAPYFRIFNPESQIKKFDPKHLYIKKWVTDLNEFSYPKPIVDHKMARERALEAYKAA